VDQVIPEKEAPAEGNVTNVNNEDEFEKDLVGIYAGPINVANVAKDASTDDANDASMEDAPTKDV
jgi:hypothetical protein